MNLVNSLFVSSLMLVCFWGAKGVEANDAAAARIQSYATAKNAYAVSANSEDYSYYMSCPVKHTDGVVYSLFMYIDCKYGDATKSYTTGTVKDLAQMVKAMTWIRKGREGERLDEPEMIMNLSVYQTTYSPGSLSPTVNPLFDETASTSTYMATPKSLWVDLGNNKDDSVEQTMTIVAKATLKDDAGNTFTIECPKTIRGTGRCDGTNNYESCKTVV